MKKFIAVLMVTLGVTSLHAEDSYLWWWVTDATTTADNGWEDIEGSWANARIKAVNSSTKASSYLNLYSSDKTQLGVGTLANIGDGEGHTKGYYGALLTGCTGNTWTYFLEVYSAQNGWVGMSKEGLSYSAANQYISLGGTDIPSFKFDFGTTTFTSVPEPNSAMLLLMGLSALALRRKRAAKKA